MIRENRFLPAESFETRVSDGTMGDVWSAVGAIGASAIQLLPGLLGGGSGSGPAQSTDEYAAFGQQVNLTLTRIREQMTLGLISPQTAASEAVRIEGLISNPQLVDQTPDSTARRAAFEKIKTDARGMVTQLQTEAAQRIAAAGGQSGTATTPLNESPLNNKNVLIGLLAVAAGLILFMSKE